MDIATMVLRIKRQFGDEYGVIINDSDIYGWIYEAELDILRNAPDAFISNAHVVGSTILTQLPENVTIQKVQVSVGGGPVRPLPYKTTEEIDEGRLDLLQASEPQFFTVRNNSILPYPSTSIGVGTYDVFYTKTPTLLTGPDFPNALATPSAFHTDVINYCLSRAHNKNQNAQSEKLLMDMYDKSLSVRRDEANTIDQNTYKYADPLDMDYVDY